MKIHYHHLQNPTAFALSCDICHREIENGPGWLCEVCPDYDVCNACYHQKEGTGGIDHPHRLSNHPSIIGTKQHLWRMHDILVHASQCYTAPCHATSLQRRRNCAHCQYPECGKVKVLFGHGAQCPTRASGGCGLCKRMWYLIQLHSQACKQSECSVPRCSEVKEHLRLRRMQQQQSDSQ